MNKIANMRKKFNEKEIIIKTTKNTIDSKVKRYTIEEESSNYIGKRGKNITTNADNQPR